MLILQQMIVLFFLMLAGFFMEKKGILDEGTSKKISWIVVNIANPAMVLSSVSGDNQIAPQELAVTTMISILMFLFLIILAIFVPRLFRVKRSQYGVYRIMTVFSNIGFMGFPIISSLYGKDALLYASLFVLPYNILIYTYGILCLTDKGESKKATNSFPQKEKGKIIQSSHSHTWLNSLKKIGNIGVFSSLAALVLFFGNIRIPEMFSQVFDMFADITAPLSMMVIGASFGRMSFKDMLTDIRLLVFSIGKLLVLPIIGMWILTQFVENKMLLGVCLVMLSTPVGSMTAMLAQQYECDKDLAARGVALTTLFSVATIPIVAAVCNLF